MHVDMDFLNLIEEILLELWFWFFSALVYSSTLLFFNFCNLHRIILYKRLNFNSLRIHFICLIFVYLTVVYIIYLYFFKRKQNTKI